MFATLAILSCLYSLGLATTSSPVISAPASFYLAQAFVDTTARHKRLLDELHCLPPPDSNSAGLPKALLVLRTKCKDNVKYRVLMRLLATVPIEQKTEKLMPLLAYIASYQESLTNLLSSLEGVKLVERLDKLRNPQGAQAGIDEKKKLLIVSQLTADHNQEFNEVVNGIFSDEYKDFASKLIDINGLKSTDDLSVDNYGEDVALKATLDDLGPILNLSQIFNLKKAADFFHAIDYSRPWLKGKEIYGHKIAAAYAHIYLYTNTNHFDNILNACEAIRKDAIQKVQSEKTIVGKLKLIAEKEAEVMDLVVDKLDMLYEAKDLYGYSMALRKSQYDSNQLLVSHSLPESNPYEWKPSYFGVRHRIKFGKLTLSMLNYVNAGPIIGSFMSPSERRTNLNPLAAADSEYSKKFHALIKDLDIKIDTTVPALEDIENIPTMYIPQEVLLTEQESWRQALKNHIMSKELTHDEHLDLHQIYEQLSDYKLKVDRPALAIYEHGGKILLKPSPVYKTLIAILKKPIIKDFEVVQLLSEGTGKFAAIHESIFSALNPIKSFVAENKNIAGTIATLSEMVEKAEQELKALSVPCNKANPSTCVPYDKAAEILLKLDKEAFSFISRNVSAYESLYRVMENVELASDSSIVKYANDVTSKFAEMLATKPKDEPDDDSDDDDDSMGSSVNSQNDLGLDENGNSDDSVMLDSLLKVLYLTVGLGILLAVLATIYMVLSC